MAEYGVASAITGSIEMTTPNTTASPEQEVERCPDCQRLVGRLAWRADGAYATDGECLARVSRAGPLYREECKDRTITRLRSDLATLQAKLDARVADANSYRVLRTLVEHDPILTKRFREVLAMSERELAKRKKAAGL